MKKIISAVLLICAVTLILTAGCIGSETQTGTATPPSTTPTTEITPAAGNETAAQTNSSRTLIAYFSRTGNTETIAKMIAAETGGTLFRITTVASYPSDYTETTEVASDEQKNNARPELATHVENIDQYDVIYLGYPIWWGTMPMAMFTFLEEYNFSGKTIVPFCTHGGSSFGRSITDITSLAPSATLLDGFEVRGSSAANAGNDVKNWIAGLNLQ